MSDKLTVIVGAGPGNSLAFDRRFLAEGQRVALLARQKDNLEQLRQQLPDAHYFPCDATRPEQIQAMFGQMRQQLGTVSMLIYNAGAAAFGNIDMASMSHMSSLTA